MSDRTTLSFGASRELSEAVEEAAREAGTSKSGLMREVLVETLVKGDEFDIPEHLVVIERREQIKRRNKVADLRGGFRGRVWQEFHSRFENGYKPDGIESIASGYVEEARLLFDEDEAADHIAYIRELVDQYREKYELGEDLHDPEEAFATFSGVEEAEQMDEEERKARDRALEEARREDANKRGFAVREVQRRAGVDAEIAEWAVEREWTAPSAAGGVYAND